LPVLIFLNRRNQKLIVMNTYSKSTAEFHENTFETVNRDVREDSNDKKYPVATSKAHVRKGTAATRLAARKKSAAGKMQQKGHAT
jgi:hypothetical protein